MDYDADPSELLRTAPTIAMVGASPDPWRPAFGIMRYLQQVGYRVVPVNPNADGQVLHGETVRSSLEEAGPVDLVNVFRHSDAVDEIVTDAIASGAPAIWTQLGIRNDAALARGRAAGLKVVANRCISVEHSRLSR